MSSLILADPGLNIDESEKLNEEAWLRALHELHAAQSHLGQFFELADRRLAAHGITSPDCLVLRRMRNDIGEQAWESVAAAISVLEMHLMFRYGSSESTSKPDRPACLGSGLTPEGPLNQAPCEEVGSA